MRVICLPPIHHWHVYGMSLGIDLRMPAANQSVANSIMPKPNRKNFNHSAQSVQLKPREMNQIFSIEV